jgi:hypothetical protein
MDGKNKLSTTHSGEGKTEANDSGPRQGTKALVWKWPRIRSGAHRHERHPQGNGY